MLRWKCKMFIQEIHNNKKNKKAKIMIITRKEEIKDFVTNRTNRLRK